MILRLIKKSVQSRLAYNFSYDPTADVSMTELASGRFTNLLDRINRKSRRKEIN